MRSVQLRKKIQELWDRKAFEHRHEVRPWSPIGKGEYTRYEGFEDYTTVKFYGYVCKFHKLRVREVRAYLLVKKREAVVDCLLSYKKMLARVGGHELSSMSLVSFINDGIRHYVKNNEIKGDYEFHVRVIRNWVAGITLPSRGSLEEAWYYTVPGSLPNLLLNDLLSIVDFQTYEPVTLFGWLAIETVAYEFRGYVNSRFDWSGFPDVFLRSS